ncbi:MAG: hypothetical protein AB1746_04120 [Candidatus Zixiibacteriota bacterium]
MHKFNAIFFDSLLEIRSRRIIYIYAAVALFMALLFGLMPEIHVSGENLFGGDIATRSLLDNLLAHFFDGFIGFVIFLMVFGSAFLIPSYLGKGRVELVLSKPISRWKLLTLKFASIYLIHIIILLLMVIIVWLTISLRLGNFSWLVLFGSAFAFVHFLLILLLVFSVGALTRSGAIAIMAYFIFRIVSGMLEGREAIYNFLGETVWTKILDWTYYILPKFGEVGNNFVSLMKGNGFVNFFSIFTTFIFCGVIYAAALYLISRRDY